MFFKGSRYEQVEILEITDPGSRIIKYKGIRFIPETLSYGQHAVVQGDRLDLIAFRYLRNPELFWRICDANNAMLPDDLVDKVGETILIPPA